MSTDHATRLDGKRIVVTGANSGLGFEATRMFADRGATVTMACRSVDRGEQAAAEIRADDPDGELDIRECDLADLDSVATFAESVRADDLELDVLCNNAGVMAIEYAETTDGFETQFGVNHLGHFALTGHLLPVLLEGDGGRVVTQSSGMHERGTLSISGIHDPNGYDKWDAYARSKLANVLFAYELQRRLEEAGIDRVDSVACHPGWAATNLQQRAGEASGSRLIELGMRAANALFAQSAKAGALPMVHAAVESDIGGESYVGPGGFMNMRGSPEIQRSSDESYDEQTADRLWEYSVEATGIEYAPIQGGSDPQSATQA